MILKELLALDEATKKPAKKVSDMPKMDYPGIKVSMLQSWQDRLPKAIKEMGHRVVASAYTDGSTKWSVAFNVPKKFNKEKFEDELRDKLNFNGWLQVEWYDMTDME